MSRLAERVWEANGVASAALVPLSWVYGALTWVRNAAFDAGLLRSHSLALPTVSVGNLSVGGTGKTPVSAWVAQELLRRGHRPAILMRGYGDDEPLVHRQLAPEALVVADPDRVAGARRARAHGATALVLDDGFQHRRARRDVDLVIVAAEQGTARRWLPAGPLRESAQGLRRADALLVTRKSATLAEAEAVAERWSQGVPGITVAVIHLAPGGLRRVADGDSGAGESGDVAGSSSTMAGSSPPALRGQRVLAVSAIGAPEAFEQQLRAEGAEVEGARYPDHHPFSAADIASLARRGEVAGMVVCTLKDAVKLGARWPRQGPPVWYLSQAVNVERGAEALHGLLDSLGAVVPSKS